MHRTSGLALDGRQVRNLSGYLGLQTEAGFIGASIPIPSAAHRRSVTSGGRRVQGREDQAAERDLGAPR